MVRLEPGRDIQPVTECRANAAATRLAAIAGLVLRRDCAELVTSCVCGTIGARPPQLMCHETIKLGHHCRNTQRRRLHAARAH
jgi:hypothetical protein